MDTCARCSGDLPPDAAACPRCGVSRVDLLLEAASSALKRGSAAIAERLCTQALHWDPRSTGALVARCQARSELPDLAGAREDARRAVEFGRLEPRDYLMLCRLFQGEERREILRQGLAVPNALTDLMRGFYARSYLDEGDFAGAIRELERLRADGLRVGLDLAIAYESLGRFADAENEFRLQGQPGLALMARMRSGDLAGALNLLDELDEGWGLQDPRRVYRAMLQALLSRPIDEPIEAITLAAELAARDGEFHLPFAILLKAGGRRDAAREILEKLVETSAQVPEEWIGPFRWELDLARGVLESLSPPIG